MRVLKSLVFTSLMVSAQVTSAAGGSLLKLMGSQKNLKESLGLAGIDYGAQSTALKNVKLAFGVLRNNNEQVTMKHLSNLGKNIPKGSEDKKLYNKLMSDLRKDADNFSTEKWVEVIDSLVMLTGRYGLNKGHIVQCAPCMDNAYSNVGFKYTLETLSDPSSQAILTAMKSRGRNYQSYQANMNKSLSKFGFAKFNKGKDWEQDAIAYMVHAEEMKGDPNIDPNLIGLIDDIKKVSKTRSGEVDIFDPVNGHAFYNFMGTKMSPEDIATRRSILQDVASVMEKDKLPTMEAFEKVLQKRVDDAPAKDKSKMEMHMRFILDNGCFGKKAAK